MYVGMHILSRTIPGDPRDRYSWFPRISRAATVPSRDNGTRVERFKVFHVYTRYYPQACMSGGRLGKGGERMWMRNGCGGGVAD